MSSDNSSRIVRFGVFEVDLKAGDLRRSGLKVKLQEQPLQVLAVLLEHPGEVVTREELRTKLWPADTFVDFDHGLNAAVGRLRDALGDSAETPRFVETVARRGYRFTAPVQGFVPAKGEPFPIGDNEVRSSPRPWQRIALVAGTLLLLAVGSSWWFVRPLLPKPQLTERRLTDNPDDAPVTSGVISPDGKYLAYTNATGFYLRQVDSGETHVLPLPKGFDGEAESWLPDSAHLVVSRVDDPKKPSSLWEISVMGGTPRILNDEGSSASVSPGGDQIAFLRETATAQEIWLMQADGDKARMLISSEEREFSRPAWSPDGKRFAYASTKYPSGILEPQTEIQVFNVNDGHSQVILSEPGLGLPFKWTALGWMPEGRLIYSLREPLPNQRDSNLWWMRLDSQTARPISSATRITSGRLLATRLSLSSDGKRLALQRYYPQPDVYIAQLEAQGSQLSAPQRLTLDEGLDYPYAWTPDSKAVLFASDRDGPWHIFKQGIDQTQPELLVGGNNDVSLPRLSPDGSILLYLVVSKPGEASINVRLMRMPLGGGPSKLVLEAPGIMNQQCARLPSTLCIYSQIAGNEVRFFTFDAVNGKGVELLAAKINDDDDDWTLSSDGKYLAGLTYGTPHTDPGIWILPLAGGPKRNIPVTGWAGFGGIDWAADNKSLWTAVHTTNAYMVALEC